MLFDLDSVDALFLLILEFALRLPLNEVFFPTSIVSTLLSLRQNLQTTILAFRLGALIQGRWYVHILSLLAIMCIGKCRYT